eukprot:g16146.t1
MAKQLAAKMVVALTLALGGNYTVEGVLVAPPKSVPIGQVDVNACADGKLGGHETSAIAGGTEIVEKCCTKTSNVNPANVNPANVNPSNVNPANLPGIPNACDHVTDASCAQMAVGFNMGSGWVKKQDGKLGHETLAIAGGTEIVEKCCTKTSNVNLPANLPGKINACDHVTDASCAQMAVNFNMGGSGWVKNQDGKLGPETLAIAGKHDGHGGTEMVKKCCTNPNASSC